MSFMNQKAIGRRIKAARDKKRLTQEQLAELVDLSPMHVSVIERGVKPPKLETFVALANALEVSADELLQDTVDHAMESNSSEIATLIQSLPRQDQQKLLSAIRAYVDAANNDK
jgi:transcriptional regulator with XRE-family HTH domain